MKAIAAEPPDVGPPADQSSMRENLRAILHEIANRAPRARVVVVTYLAILPPTGTCPQLGIGEAEAALMRAVGDRLADVTRGAAEEARTIVVDMATLSGGHDACSRDPWVNGAAPADGAPFHPTLAGAIATAQLIAQALDRLP